MRRARTIQTLQVRAAALPVRYSRQMTIEPGAVATVQDNPWTRQLINFGDLTLVEAPPLMPGPAAPAPTQAASAADSGSSGGTK